ncbi:MAG: PAS domain-containing protein [Pirellulales bacterium]|nr:PAS domain-containing protein [Pirellulales bacterium]
MGVTLVLATSVVLQLVAAILALRLTLITHAGRAWMLISAAVFLMVIRRSVTLLRLIFEHSDPAPDLVAELVALGSSVLMVVGIAWIAPLFLSMNQHRKKVEESEERYRTVADYTYDWEYWIGTDGNYLYISPACQRITGYTVEEFQADPDLIHAITHTEDRESLARHTSQEIEHEEVLSLTYRIFTREGQLRWIEHKCQPVYGKDGCYSGRRANNRDVTDRKLVEEERDRLIAKLEAQNTELERFTYTVSHDLKSPLVSIQGFVGILQQDLERGEPERVKDDLARISNATGKMDHLLRKLLELARVGRLVNPSENVPLEALARETIELIAGQAEKYGVQIEISADLPVVFGDRLRLREVMQNLLENAIKYMGDQPQPRIEIGSRREGNETICYVRDNGIGIEPCYHEKVFGVFERLDSTREGSGLGLALVKRILDAHGGRIWVESDGSGHGSTFCFSISTKDADISSS